MIKHLTYLSLLFLSACGGDNGLHEDKKHHSLIDRIEHSTPDSIHYSVNIEDLMADIKKVKANVPDEEFYILERTSMIKSYPCSNCHNESLDHPEKVAKGAKRAHWDINLKHAGKETMDCATCHDTNDMNKLQTLTGKMVTFDESFKSCAQCHSQQYKEWVGGAHGKRVAGWAPPRLIYTCSNCHNPHDPSIKPRWPARLNTHKLKEINNQ